MECIKSRSGDENQDIIKINVVEEKAYFVLPSFCLSLITLTNIEKKQTTKFFKI